MRWFLLTFLVGASLSCSTGISSAEGSCRAASISEERLFEIAAKELSKRGRVIDRSTTRTEIVEKECNYLVRVTYLPEVAGGYVIFEIDRSGSVLTYWPGL